MTCPARRRSCTSACMKFFCARRGGDRPENERKLRVAVWLNMVIVAGQIGFGECGRFSEAGRL